MRRRKTKDGSEPYTCACGATGFSIMRPAGGGPRLIRCPGCNKSWEVGQAITCPKCSCPKDRGVAADVSPPPPEA